MSVWQRLAVLAGLGLFLWLVHALGPVLVPFVVSAILAYMGDPLVDRLENWRVPRGIAVAIVFLLTFIALTLVLLVLIPALIQEVSGLLAKFPEALTWVQDQALPWLSQRFGVDITPAHFDVQKLSKLVADYFSQMAGFAGGALGSITRSGGAFVAWIANLLLIPLVTFYTLRDWDLLMAKLRDLLPQRWRERVVILAGECDEALSAFLRGQLLVMLGLGILYSVGLWIIGLNNALAIGMLAGLVSFVPYLGVITGVVLAVLTGLLQNPSLVFLAEIGVVFTIGQLAESFVLTPKLVGDRIGLHPVLVIFAVMAGGQLFGFVGVLLALPVAAAGLVLTRHAIAEYRASRWFREPPQGEA